MGAGAQGNGYTAQMEASKAAAAQQNVGVADNKLSYKDLLKMKQGMGDDPSNMPPGIRQINDQPRPGGFNPGMAQPSVTPPTRAKVRSPAAWRRSVAAG